MVCSSGITGLDKVIHNLKLGDNVVWQVDDINSYRYFVEPFVTEALKQKKNLVYIRFAKHPALISSKLKIKTYKLDPTVGFEAFSKEVHEIITKEGEGAFYIFDSLSDLQSAWATDLMIGNFFLVTCPYLFKLNTIAYFAILRHNHAYRTIARIRETTQLLLDLYHYEDKYYIHPLKVWQRYSPTMFLPHLKTADELLPITNSVDAAKLFAYIQSSGVESAQRNLDYWDKIFARAERLLGEKGKDADKQAMLEQLCRIMLTREERMLKLALANFTLIDLLNIKARMIGTGYIGGKALGMLLARKILINTLPAGRQEKDGGWDDFLEPHDSFYIGSDVFYTYIVENGWWKLWLEQKSQEGYLAKAAELKDKMLEGQFPDEIQEQFQQMIEYFGQSPIIVRSSSLLEDSFGNAFAGKYESVFNVNQGDPEARYKNFVTDVHRVFASTMSEEALNYRLQRGLSQHDEQMSLLVQRVSGARHKQYFFPFIGGVGVSYNTFVWQKELDPKAGLLRLVFGLGTRAVNRVEGDYPRVVALDKPLASSYARLSDRAKYSQHEIDLLNISSNELETVPTTKLLAEEPELDLSLIASPDTEAQKKMSELGLPGKAEILTFDGLLSQTDFAPKMKRLLAILEEKYQYPVDVEFTVNFTSEAKMQVNLVQCRPLQAKGLGGAVSLPKKIDSRQVIFAAEGNFMGGNVIQEINKIIYVDPDLYSNLLMSEKFEVARIIGRINKTLVSQRDSALLIGPGRWGTRDPSLGVPVSFAEINNIKALVEVDDPVHGFTPELSFGSHFFLDLVEAGIFYVALFVGKEGTLFNQKFIFDHKNLLLSVVPEATKYQQVVKMIDFGREPLKLLSDITTQKVGLFIKVGIGTCD